MERHILNLYKQYCDARKIIFNPLNLNDNSNDFIDWIISNMRLASQYKSFLLHLGYLEGKQVLEIGKGKYDSLYLKGSRFVSPYAYAMGKDNSQLFLIGNIPLIEAKGKIFTINSGVLLTHNPYEEMIVNTWYKIHNSKVCDISVGMYGTVHDGDFDLKIKLLEELSKKMDNDYVIDYDTDKDNYFCSLNSKRKVKIKILTR